MRHLTSCSWSMQMAEAVVGSILNISCLLFFKVKSWKICIDAWDITSFMLLEPLIWYTSWIYSLPVSRTSYTIYFVNISFASFFFLFPSLCLSPCSCPSQQETLWLRLMIVERKKCKSITEAMYNNLGWYASMWMRKWRCRSTYQRYISWINFSKKKQLNRPLQ
jgi:hypothetical protein